MALTINPEILGQQADSSLSYCYLYEPLRINIEESDLEAEFLYVDIIRFNINDSSALPILEKYAMFDINPGKSLTFDLMEITRQLHDSNIFKIANLQDIFNSNNDMILSKYYYQYEIYSNTSLERSIVKKSPIIGGREFQQFVATVNENQPLTEFDYYGIDIFSLSRRWSNYQFYKATLAGLQSTDLRPNIEIINNIEFFVPKGGVLFWKSRFGGWMFWGFDIEKKTYSHSYGGDLEVGMFDSTQRILGNPFVPVNYSQITNSYSIELKSLALTKIQLLAVAGITSATAIYYAKDNTGRLELMKLASASIPLDNLASGGDFSVVLKNISQTFQKTR